MCVDYSDFKVSVSRVRDCKLLCNTCLRLTLQAVFCTISVRGKKITKVGETVL